MPRIIAKLTIGIAVLIVLTLAQSYVDAQNAPEATQKTQALTGCLERGDAVSTYKLVIKDGSWNLTATDNLKLGRQVDHTVIVRGKVVEPFDTKAPDKEGAHSDHRGLFNVSSIKLISTTCTK